MSLLTTEINMLLQYMMPMMFITPRGVSLRGAQAGRAEDGRRAGFGRGHSQDCEHSRNKMRSAQKSSLQCAPDVSETGKQTHDAQTLPPLAFCFTSHAHPACLPGPRPHLCLPLFQNIDPSASATQIEMTIRAKL